MLAFLVWMRSSCDRLPMGVRPFSSLCPIQLARVGRECLLSSFAYSLALCWLSLLSFLSYGCSRMWVCFLWDPGHLPLLLSLFLLLLCCGRSMGILSMYVPYPICHVPMYAFCSFSVVCALLYPASHCLSSYMWVCIQGSALSCGGIAWRPLGAISCQASDSLLHPLWDRFPFVSLFPYVIFHEDPLCDLFLLLILFALSIGCIAL